MSILGQLLTTSMATDLAKKSFAGQLLRFAPNGQAPIFALSSLLGTETAVQTEHGYFQKTSLFPFGTYVSGGTTSGTVTQNATENLVVNYGSSTQFDGTATSLSFIAGQILVVFNNATNVPTGEIIQILTVTDNGSNQATLSVRRNIGNVSGIGSGTSLSSGYYLIEAGNANEEGSQRPTAVAVAPVRVTNLTQIFRNSWAVTNTAAQTNAIAGTGNVSESRMDCMQMHAAAIEKSLLWSQLNGSYVFNSKPMRTMQGIYSYLNSSAIAQTQTLGSTTTQTQLETALDSVFDVNTDPRTANTRLLFCGGTAKRVINNIGRLNGTYYITQETNTFGMQFSTYRSARGSFEIVEHPLFNSNPAFKNMALALDITSTKIAYLGNRRQLAQDYNDSGTPVDQGVDATGGTLTSECTLMLKNPKANKMLFGFTAAAKD